MSENNSASKKVNKRKVESRKQEMAKLYQERSVGPIEQRKKRQILEEELFTLVGGHSCK